MVDRDGHRLFESLARTIVRNILQYIVPQSITTLIEVLEQAMYFNTFIKKSSK
ncbi:unnamed protein product, partial [Rotaria sp. Silwood2]